ncbi:multidrug ABC transporter ATP-binding protein [Brachybacterium vulturis]|uniref:Multidrug ABC transporter ATP-binding protein n=1 Tax=Brachybacterium vulturis TaxID=2017484 RepID=A0A291GJY1_9MICO|nr:multidrug ABC transporter ATP-binding protein [Brachybacterium vulturis]
MPIVELTDVSKSYGSNVLFQGVNLAIEDGRIYGLRGPNGSGKSVLFRLMTGFVLPDTGSITIDPRYRDPRNTFPQEFGIVIDRPGYMAGRTGLDNLLSLAQIRGVIGEAEVREAMRGFGLDPDSSTKVGRYSLGMKQKLSLVQATMEGQRVLILDEPFNALDHSSSEALRERLATHRESGGTVVMTSHNEGDFAVLADEIHEIDRGTLIHTR